MLSLSKFCFVITVKKHVFGSFDPNNSEKHRFSFEDMFLEHYRHLYEKNEPTLGSSGGRGVHGNVCLLIAYYGCNLMRYNWVFFLAVCHLEWYTLCMWINIDVSLENLCKTSINGPKSDPDSNSVSDTILE